MKLPEAITCVRNRNHNRNQYITAFLLHLVHTHKTIKLIEQKYLESGMTVERLYGDSIHSAIEKKKRFIEAYSIIDWKRIIQRRDLRFEKTLPGFIKYRYDYDGPYHLLNTLCKPGRPNRRTPNSEMPPYKKTKKERSFTAL